MDTVAQRVMSLDRPFTTTRVWPERLFAPLQCSSIRKDLSGLTRKVLIFVQTVNIKLNFINIKPTKKIFSRKHRDIYF